MNFNFLKLSSPQELIQGQPLSILSINLNYYHSYSLQYIYMQKQDYTNFRDQVTNEQIAVGVPIRPEEINLQRPPMAYNMPNPHQGYYPNIIPNQNLNHQEMQVVAHQPQNFQPIQQIALNYNYPISIRCPCCHSNVSTIVNNQSGNTTYLWSFLICLCISPCCVCVPFMIDSCMDKNHYCPNCGFNIIRKHKGFLEC